MSTAIRYMGLAAVAIAGVAAFLAQPTITQKLESCGYQVEGQRIERIYVPIMHLPIFGDIQWVVDSYEPGSKIKEDTHFMFITRRDGTGYLQPSEYGKVMAGELLKDCENTKRQREESRRG